MVNTAFRGAARHGGLPGLHRVGQSGLYEASRREMPEYGFRLGGGNLGKSLLNRHADTLMQFLPSRAQQGVVCCVLHQRMLEYVVAPCTMDQLCMDELQQGFAEFGLR